ncbi:MAG: desulfoferrodoxin [Firmicutes bacterium]|nr:desulfoferrodoxin [Bacillota bacterium]
MTEVTFYICNNCGNLVQVIEKGGPTPSCCGEPMQKLVPNTVDASQEKHVPVVEMGVDKVKVTIGSVAHPMTEPHYIGWLYLQYPHGGELAYLDVTGEPEHTFILGGEKPVAVYAYCNLHGLWKTEIE